ncbi:MAG: hypothetical protein EBY61_10490, partial [Actinobacteria bacterium]|nr:hypothetical protein [Actinomycetota bacterium]
ETSIGKDLVKVYERNGIECSITEAGCCGAPWLHSGDLKQFTKIAEKNVKTLADEVRRGGDIVVPQPTCGYVLKKDYLDYVGGPDAELVASHTYDAAEYLVGIHKGEETSLDTEFTNEVPEKVTYHAPCHLRAQNIGFKSRDLMKLTGAKVKLVQQCSGIDGMWGFRAENEEISIPIAKASRRLRSLGVTSAFAWDFDRTTGPDDHGGHAQRRPGWHACARTRLSLSGGSRIQRRPVVAADHADVYRWNHRDMDPVVHRLVQQRELQRAPAVFW